jgi:tetratricopeptide (TPR) repeat protein
MPCQESKQLQLPSARIRLRFCHILFLLIIAAGAYWNTLPNDFVAGDRQFILRNENIGDFSTVLNAFTSDYWGKLGGESFIYYRPLVILTHFIDFKLYGLNPAGHHLTNMVFHCIVTLTVYLVFLTFLSGKRWPAFAGAALFALHPIHTHSVSYVMGRTDILATMFFLWALILLAQVNRQHVVHSKIPMLLLACASFFCALLCKEIAITLPLVFVFYRFCFARPIISWHDKGLITPLVFLMVTVCFYLVIRVFAVGISSEHAALPWFSISQKIWLVFKTLGFYLTKLLFPVKLCYYSNMVVPGSWSEVLASPLIWAGVFFPAIIAVAVRHSLSLGFALGWILLTLLPVLNIIMLPALAKENYLYLPSIGFCLSFAVIFDKGMQQRAIRRTWYPRIAVSGTVLIALWYAAGTINRNHDYKTPLSFLESTIKNMPPVAVSRREDPRFFEPVKNFYTTHKNLGIIYQECNQPEKAIDSFRSALGYTPSFFSMNYAASVKVLLAILLDQTGRLEEAFIMLKAAQPFAYNKAAIDNRLGIVASKLGNDQEAEFYFQQAIMKDSTYAAAHYNLGIMYMKSRAIPKGIEELGIASRLNPKYTCTLAHYSADSIHGD